MNTPTLQSVTNSITERERRTEPPRHNLSNSHWNRAEPPQPPKTVENWRSEDASDDREPKMRGERQYGRNFNYDAYVNRKRESPSYGSDEGRREVDRNLAVDRPREPPSPSASDPGSRRDADSFVSTALAAFPRALTQSSPNICVT